MKDRIYLDHAATTPLLPEARDAMQRWLHGANNPSSLHSEGRAARQAVDQARETLSRALGCLFGEVVFMSGGTEGANLALLGTALANKDARRRRVLIGAAEHHCVLHTKPLLERLGYVVELVPVDREAGIRLDCLEDLLSDDVLLVSVMQANNELGTLNPVSDVAAMAHGVGAVLHCDAVQTFPFGGSVEELGADLLSVSSHKIYGPQGAGALSIRSGTEVAPILVGGGQERDMRAGTENVAAIVGFSEAVAWNIANPEVLAKKEGLRDVLAARLVAKGFVPSVVEHRATSLPGHFHCRYPGVPADTLLIRLDRAGLSASSGAACSSGSLEPSHVLAACGYNDEECKEGLRFTFGKDNNLEETERAAKIVVECIDAVTEVQRQ